MGHLSSECELRIDRLRSRTRISESSWLVAAAFQCPRCSPDGEEDVRSLVRKYKDLNLSTVMDEKSAGMGGTMFVLRWCSNDLVAGSRCRSWSIVS